MFKSIDNDSDNVINDSEWYSFYDVFLKNFNSCDKDKSNSLSEEEVKACLLDVTGPFKNIRQIAD